MTETFNKAKENSLNESKKIHNRDSQWANTALALQKEAEAFRDMVSQNIYGYKELSDVKFSWEEHESTEV